MHTIVIADGEVRHGRALERSLMGGPSLIVAADGGADKALKLGLRPQLVVGDGDSLAADRIAQLRHDGVEVIVHSAAKDESDTELALREAVARGASSIVLVGAFGGPRLEHGIANLLLLALPELSGVEAAIVDGPSTVRLLGVPGRSEIRITGAPTDFISLLPLTETVEGVTISGLRFPLDNATLTQGPARGLSNELIETEATVSVRRGRLVVIHTARAEVDEVV